METVCCSEILRRIYLTTQVKVQVKFTLELATKAQWEGIGIDVLFL